MLNQLRPQILILLLLLFHACRSDQGGSESELIEDDTSSVSTALPDQSVDSSTVLDVASEHMGALQEKEGKQVIISSSLVKKTLTEDYGNLKLVKELFPATFATSATAVTDAARDAKDSIISLKSKMTNLQFRKTGTDNPVLVSGTLREETYILQNGVSVGMNMKEVLAKFGIRDDVDQDRIDVISNDSKQRIELYFKKGELSRIDLVP